MGFAVKEKAKQNLSHGEAIRKIKAGLTAAFPEEMKEAELIHNLERKQLELRFSKGLDGLYEFLQDFIARGASADVLPAYPERPEWPILSMVSDNCLLEIPDYARMRLVEECKQLSKRAQGTDKATGRIREILYRLFDEQANHLKILSDAAATHFTISSHDQSATASIETFLREFAANHKTGASDKLDFKSIGDSSEVSGADKVWEFTLPKERVGDFINACQGEKHKADPGVYRLITAFGKVPEFKGALARGEITIKESDDKMHITFAESLRTMDGPYMDIIVNGICENDKTKWKLQADQVNLPGNGQTTVMTFNAADINQFLELFNKAARPHIEAQQAAVKA
jgi:hypothetical protein